MHDLKLLRAQGGEGFVGQPKSLFPGSTYRYERTAMNLFVHMSRLGAISEAVSPVAMICVHRSCDHLTC